MKRKALFLFAALCLLLSGCSTWMDGYYFSESKHTGETMPGEQDMVSAANYSELRDALLELVHEGRESGTISVAAFVRDVLEDSLQAAIDYAERIDPIGSYAVAGIHYELGTSGVPAVAVSITYDHGRGEILQIRETENLNEAKVLIGEALNNYEPSIVLKVSDYIGTDFDQLVQDYGDMHPERVMETPQVTVAVYPDRGSSRVVELHFTYQSSRDALRNMQSMVETVFTSAKLYVSGDGADREKYSQLYSFITERYDYVLDTSITPAYSLLRHGVGDSKAFAIVYAAMCRESGLACYTVSGTRNGEPWFWNIILDNGVYRHVDAAAHNETSVYQEWTDAEMTGYVWDYSAYPACVGEPEASQ